MWMISVWLGAIVVSLCLGSDTTMGIYEGSYTSSAGESGPLRGRLVALGKSEYVARIELTEWGRNVEIMGSAERNRTTFRGSVDLGVDLGGTYRVEAVVEDSDLKGTFSGASAQGRISLTKVSRTSPTLGAKPVEGAVVLFDGSGLDQWTGPDGKPADWRILPDGTMEVGQGNIISRQSFGDVRIHLEFRTPFMPEARGQARGNSGVYVQGRYEVQVLDSFGLEPKDNECGGIYEIAAPLVNACLPPLEWQTYDIEFRAPRFDAAGRKTVDAVISVRHNGIVIHEEVKVPRPTRASLDNEEVPKAGLMLQDHGNPVQYRNIWVLSADEPR